MSNQGKLMVVSGFSGVGKGTVIKQLMEENPNFVFSVSGTSRYMREGEVHGVHYFFLTKEEFEEGIREGKFLEHAQYAGNYYGTPRDYVMSQMEQGNNVVLDIEVQGALQVMERLPEAKSIYLIAPSAEILIKRLMGRGTENTEQIKARMLQAIKETEIIPSYQHILINDTIEETIRNILAVADGAIQSAEEREKAMKIVEEIRRDLPAIIESL